MPIFGDAASPFDESVEKVTAETMTSENWALMIDICDRVSAEGAPACRKCLLSVKKRLNHRDPHVTLLALSLLDCLWNNCGPAFRREVSSKEFISELSYKATSSNRIVGDKTRELIKKWSENECKKDDSLSLVESLYRDLLNEGLSFERNSRAQKSGQKMFSDDPNVVATDEEQEHIAKAIALSLSDAKEKERKGPTGPNSAYFNLINSVRSTHTPQASNARQVRALYDFEAAEENELSFTVGEIITILDDSDPNWWRGSTGHSQPRTGLFPSSFVTSDLEPAQSSAQQNNHAAEEVEYQQEPPRVQIDEDALLKCIQLLEDCDPNGEVPDSQDLSYYEQASMAQAPLIDQKLAQIDKQHNMLAKIDVAIRDVLASYDSAVQQVQYQIQQQSTAMPQPAASSYHSAGNYHPTPMPIESAGMPTPPAATAQLVAPNQQQPPMMQQPQPFIDYQQQHHHPQQLH